MRNLDASFWSPPARIDRRYYPSVHLFLPPASGQASVTRILNKLAPPLYEFVAPEHEAWRNIDSLDGGTRPYRVESHGVLYHWWYGAKLVEDALHAAELAPARARTIVILRDPRDSLVSLYHLTLDPRHEPPKDSARYQTYLHDRERLRQRGLDEYVLETGNGWVWQLEQVTAFFDRCAPANTLFISYALLCHDFPQFLQQLMHFLRVTPPQAVVEELLRTEDVRRSDSLNPKSLARFANAAPMPGRHKRDLQPDTIAKLNECSAGSRAWMRKHEREDLRSLYED